MFILRLLSCPDCAIESAQAALIGGGQKVQRILSWPEERTANYNQNGLELLSEPVRLSLWIPACLGRGTSQLPSHDPFRAWKNMAASCSFAILTEDTCQHSHTHQPRLIGALQEQPRGTIQHVQPTYLACGATCGYRSEHDMNMHLHTKTI